MTRIRINALFCCLALVFFAEALQADQITMKDGDRITGSVVKKDGNTLTVKSKNFGEVKIKWDDVADIKTDQALNVVLSGGQTVRANIEGQNGRVQVGSESVPQGTSQPCGTTLNRKLTNGSFTPAFWISGPSTEA